MSDTSKSLNISVKDRKKVYFEGNASSVTSINIKGEFDILPMHADFITLVKKYVVVDRGLATQQQFDIDNGVLAVLANKVYVYVGV
ncbi:hypothetical protein KAZ57_02320 [Patescibacteria group bacterium]|nr:hypothetical protein [Patescibacteria group bacterium]